MAILRIALLSLLAVTGIAAAQQALTAEDALKLTVEAMEKAQEIRDRRREATTVAREWQSEASRAAQELAKPYDPERVKKLTGFLERYQQHLSWREAVRDAAKVKSPEGRAAKREEIKRELKAVEKKMAEATRDDSRRQRKLWQVVQELGRPHSPQRLEKLTRELEREQRGKAVVEEKLAIVRVPREGPAKQAARNPFKPWDTRDVKTLERELGRRQEGISIAEAVLTAAKVESPAERATRKAECMRQREEARKRMQAATVGERRQQDKLRRVEQELGQPYSVTRLAELTEWAGNERRQASRTRDQLDAASVEQQEERAAKKAEAEAQMKEARRAYQAVQEPFGEELEELREDYREVSDALVALMDGVPRIPKGIGIASVRVSADATGGRAYISWLDAAGTGLAWAFVDFTRGKPRTVTAYVKGRERVMLAGKYPAGGHNERSIHFWAGGMNVSFIVYRAEWKSRDKVLELVQSLIDLDALAVLPTLPPPE